MPHWRSSRSPVGYVGESERLLVPRSSEPAGLSRFSPVRRAPIDGPPAPLSRDSRERAWWLRVLVVLRAPRAVFAALRDDSEAASSARQEPVTAIVFLAGVAAALAAARNAELLDREAFDALLVAVWVIAAGGVQGLAAYWLLGAALYAGLSGVGNAGPFRRVRHLFAYACVPLVAALVVVWPLRLAAFRGDVFRDGGSDEGALARVLDVAEVAAYLWAAVLLLVGVRTVYSWSWGRSLAASGLAVVVLGAASLVLALVG